MTARSPSAFMLSATLHATVAAGLFLIGYVANQEPKDTAKVFELVAGEGDNYTATVAPALGMPGVKLSVPAPPAKLPEPPTPEPAKVEPTPEPAPITPPPKPTPKTPAPAPTPKAPDKTDKSPPNFAKQIRRGVIVAESKAKREIAKERADEAKRQKELERQRAKAAASNPKVAKIDAVGIAKGVLGGSTANKEGGANGKALVAEEGSAAERYGALLLQQLKEGIDNTPGLQDGLRAEAEFHIMADGTLTRAKVIKSSGDDIFDRAVLHAVASVRMPPRPRGIDEVQIVPFSTHAKD
jgi:colicin import membrane protein